LSRRNILDDERLIAILGEIGKGVLSHEHKIRKKLGLSGTEFKGILCIGEEEKITCREFAKRMELSLSRGSRILESLHTEKYIERADCASDRRCKNIWLTKKGVETRRMITEEIQNIEEALTAGYPDAKIILLKSDLRHLCQKF
jgi:DNA-binding MarR family transcriptional regulator